MKIKFTNPGNKKRAKISVPLAEIMCIFSPFKVYIPSIDDTKMMKEYWEVRILMSRNYFERHYRKPEHAVMRYRFVTLDEARKWSESVRERRRDVLDINTYLSPTWKDHRTKSRTESIFGHNSSSPVFTPTDHTLPTMTPIPMTPGFRVAGT